MSLQVKFFLLTAGLLFAFAASPAKADSLSIVYTSSQNPTAVVSGGFTPVVFTGYVTNNAGLPITFQLSYVLGPPSSFYVASFVQGIAYPGITLAGGQSTSVFDLAAVNLNPFDPSLTYPGVVDFTLEAISPSIGGLITASADSIDVQTAVPEPSTLYLMASSLLIGYFIVGRKAHA